MNPESLKGHLELLLLSTLAQRPAHGYAVLERLREGSGGTFALPEGTIYPALHRMEAAGWLQSRWESESGRRRRVYRLSAHGRRALSERTGDWRRFAQGVEAVLAGGEA